MCLVSQEMRKLAPELDPLRIGTGWKKEDNVEMCVDDTEKDKVYEKLEQMNLLR